jgi:hypothetical protein
MSKGVLVFVFIPRVDPYINAITHFFDVHHVDEVIFVEIREPPIPSPPNFSELVDTIWESACLLANGRYRDSTGGTRDLPGDYAVYGRLVDTLSRQKHTESIIYHDLRKGLIQLKRKYGEGVSVDITGVPKRLAADILASSLAAGIDDVFLFELREPYDGLRPTRFLYHNLSNTKFDHVRLPDSAPMIANLTLFSLDLHKSSLLCLGTAVLVSLLLLVGFSLMRDRLGDASTAVFLASALVELLSVVLAVGDLLLKGGFFERLLGRRG